MDKRVRHLRKDPILRKIIDRYPAAGFLKTHRSTNHFKSLVVAIANQQLSGKAAATIVRRFIALFPNGRFPTPQAVKKMPAAKMRTAGLSRAKVSFIKDLADKVLDGTLNFRKMNQWSDEEVIEHLVRVKGIGRWSAEMFLMFSLGRPDVFSQGDLGLRNAIQKHYGLRRHPTPAQTEKIVALWKPYRTLAARYLWESLDNAPKSQ